MYTRRFNFVSFDERCSIQLSECNLLFIARDDRTICFSLLGMKKTSLHFSIHFLSFNDHSAFDSPCNCYFIITPSFLIALHKNVSSSLYYIRESIKDFLVYLWNFRISKISNIYCDV